MASPVADSYSAASGATIYAGRSASVPAWRVGQAVNAWVGLTGSAMVNFPPTINPGRSSGTITAKLDAWNGVSIDTRSNEVWSVANGGHDDYHGNEVDKFTLGANVPAWVEVLPSNSAAEFTVPSNTARYTSGRPASIHSYYSQQYIEARNRAMRFGLGAISTTGSSFPVLDGFNTLVPIGTDGWDAVGAYPSWPQFAPDMPVCKNPVTEDVYCFNYNNAVYKWTQSTSVISTINVGYPPASMIASASAYDTLRNRIYLFYPNATSYTFSESTGLFTAQTLTGSAAINSTLYGAGVGMVYVPVLAAYLVMIGKDGGGTVYKIDASTFVVSVLPTTGGSSIPVPANTNAQNVYGKFLYAPTLGGVVFFANYASDAWFLRVN